ncbi:hypothetical protein MIND_01050900 [Mycena indigotica]|uniref:Uncharacterized protein n=1 Tax=Mycena indigotica TaxID=2126181 RepID=A0A8H6VV65_9AGAR|nr:uncharacterized protein MIND_01050900 [Mycena indigotica]KAF7295124.1 hypothetical protein MIND_01050900 [Mycena indigotica]
MLMVRSDHFRRKMPPNPNVEVFKFAVYLFVPLFSLVYFGDPAWYHKHVAPYRDKLLPPIEKTVRDLPFEQSRVREELERIKQERRDKTERRKNEDSG